MTGQTPDAAHPHESVKPGPSEDYKALLRGEITSEEYVKRLKAIVDAMRLRHQAGRAEASVNIARALLMMARIRTLLRRLR